MKKKLASQFLGNYLLVLLLSVLAGFCVLLLLSFADGMMTDNLKKNQYTAQSLMQDDYRNLDAAEVVANGGGVQAIDGSYHVVFSQGIDHFGTDRLSKKEFTDFLMDSQRIGVRYHYDVAYHETSDYWLVVTFPTSVRIDLALAVNKDASHEEMASVLAILAGAFLLYLLMLAGFTYLLSKVAARGIIRPLRKLTEGARLLREGNYSARVDLRLENEFAELQDTFNDMAKRIEAEIALRKQSETDRRQLILDISHDLKNPLASVAGYSELCLKNPDLPHAEREAYLKVIHGNSLRASRLLSELFELSKLESPAFRLDAVRTDLCEYLRVLGGEMIPRLEQEQMAYEFDIPEGPVYAPVDPEHLRRVFHNLADNAIRYSGPGTKITLRLEPEHGGVRILFMDNGPGMEASQASQMFKPFVRADQARNSQTGGSGLGLSIVQKIIEAHRGTISLAASPGEGFRFEIRIPES